MPAPRLSLSQVTKTYGSIRAVWNVDLEVYPGDFVAVFGPNGAGKTTLLGMIASLIRPTRGEVRLASENAPLDRSRVGYVSHKSLLYNELTSFENMLFYARLYGLEGAPERARRMVVQMGLEEAMDRPVAQFSRGMKQRLTVGRALLHEPEILLLDEPYTGLDRHGGRLLTGILEGLKEEGRTVLLITHNLDEGLELCTRAVIQHRGELVFQAPREHFDKFDFEDLYFQAVKLEKGAVHVAGTGVVGNRDR